MKLRIGGGWSIGSHALVAAFFEMYNLITQHKNVPMSVKAIKV